MELLKIKENGAYTDDCNVSVTDEGKPCNEYVTAKGKSCSVDKISKDKISKGKNNSRKRLPDFHKEEGEETDIKATRSKLFGEEMAV